jgi:hypothetical protein
MLQQREETDRVYTFLAALNSSYEAIRAQIFLSTEKLTFDAVTALIQKPMPSQPVTSAPERASQEVPAL